MQVRISPKSLGRIRVDGNGPPLREGRFLGYAMLSPAVVAIAVILVVPLVYAVVTSFYEWGLADLRNPKLFVGWDNYVRLFQDRIVVRAFLNTVGLTFLAVSIELLIGLSVAVALYVMGWGQRVANSLILLPLITAPVVVALMWRYLLDPQFGLVNYLLSVVGVGGQPAWLANPVLAPISIIAIDAWQWTPFVILVLYAGMTTVREDLIEAAEVDGASLLPLVRYVILPHLRPLIVLVILLRGIDVFRLFDTVFVLTRGGPGLATETLGLATYRYGFILFEMGYAMAISVAMLLVVLAGAGFGLRRFRRAAAQ